MFLRYTTRKKNGKEHRYYSLVENRRVASGRVVQRHALYLGEINDRQQEAWRKTIEIFEEGQTRPRTVALFPEDRVGPVEDADIVRIRLSQRSLDRPRQWGACWLACELWEPLGLDRFWAEHLKPSRKGTRWDWVLQILVTFRLLDPGSAWRLYRHWFEHSAIADLLGADQELAEIRIEARLFIAFLAYCLHVTLHRRLRDLAPGLTPRSVLEKFATIQMLDVFLPTTDGRTVVLTRYTNPETDVNVLLQRLKLELPSQPPPKITAPHPKAGAVL